MPWGCNSQGLSHGVQAPLKARGMFQGDQSGLSSRAHSKRERLEVQKLVSSLLKKSW